MGQRLKGKIAIITGAAGGIGRASAVRFAQEGAFVYINDIQAEGAEETVALLKKVGGEGALAVGDVTNAAEVKAMVERAASERGRLDVIYNNAGGGLDTPTHETSIEKFHQLMALNFNAVFYGVHAALPIMMKQKSGAFINVSSVVGIDGNAGQANYAASKSGIIGFTKSVAKELGSRSIRANAIAPGFIMTEMTQAIPQAEIDAWLKSIPLNRPGTVKDVSDVCVFLGSDPSSYVTGQVIHIDGGMKM